MKLLKLLSIKHLTMFIICTISIFVFDTYGFDMLSFFIIYFMVFGSYYCISIFTYSSFNIKILLPYIFMIVLILFSVTCCLFNYDYLNEEITWILFAITIIPTAFNIRIMFSKHLDKNYNFLYIYFILLLYYPIGLWFLQPIFNNTYEILKEKDLL